MSGKSLHFSCPLCNMHAPIERITEEGPFAFALFEKVLGGKVKLTQEEKEKQISYGFRRFYVAGKLTYLEVPMEERYVELIRERIAELEID